MSEHYYAKQPKVKSDRKLVTSSLLGVDLHFTTDSGVFSKGGIDFGSRLLIESFVMPAVAGKVLDLGCGYGPIGVTLGAVYPDREIHMVDMNERAIQLSQENAASNEVANVEIYSSDGLASVEEVGFAAILTNPPIRAGKEVVFSFYDHSYSKLVVGGELWVVIQKKQGAPSTMKRLEELFGNVTVVSKQKGYYILKSIKV